MPMQVVDLLVRHQIITEKQRPDSCVVNVYGEGMWLPPHVDSSSFARPFCTLSLLSQQDVVFGNNIEGAEGQWTGPLSVSMPTGSVLRVDGAAAGPACKHATASPRQRRISMTFRRLSQVSREQFARQSADQCQRQQQKILEKRAKKAKAESERTQQRQLRQITQA
jgi:hypothetical protein